MVTKFFHLIAKHQLLAQAAILLCAIVFPLAVSQSSYVMNIAVMALTYAILTLSLNLVTGFLGTTNLGQAAFFGVGAYTAAILSTKLDVPFLLTLPLAAIVAGLVGMLLGFITLRVSGRYLSIVTLGFCEIARLVELNWYTLTRGPLGIMNIPAPKVFGFAFETLTGKYYIVLILTVLVTVAVIRMIHSRTGRAISAIKSDQLAADVMGINVKRTKILVFVVASGIAGLAGGFYAHYISFIDPTSFNYNKSIQIMSMAILGGMGSIPGSIIGAVILTVLPELLRDFVLLRQVIYGVVIIIMVLFRPAGLLGGVNFKHMLQRLSFRERTAAEGVGNE